MTSTIRCGKCGLTQFDAGTCRRCGAALVRPALARVRGRDVRHPLLSIWFAPRDTIRLIVSTDATRGVLAVSWFAGFGMLLDGMTSKVSEKFPLGAAILGALLIGPLVSFALVFSQGLLTSLTGRLFGGRANPAELRAAFAWAQAPLLSLLILWFLSAAAPTTALKFGVEVAGFGVFLWSETLAVLLVSEVHGISVARGLGAIALAWLIKITLIVGLVSMTPLSDAPKSKPPQGPEAGETTAS